MDNFGKYNDYSFVAKNENGKSQEYVSDSEYYEMRDEERSEEV